MQFFFCSVPGRSDSGWTDWFESMIKTDKFEIQILMSAPKTHVLGKSRVLRKSPDESVGENNEAVGDLEAHMMSVIVGFELNICMI